ncbi:MAG: beta strand repeat-containing protein, partial [Burkholderiales bacterium]
MTASSVTTDQIQELYIAYFGRPAAPAGLAYWYGQAQSGLSLDSIGTYFANSPELVAQIPGLVPTALTPDTAGALVNNFFENLFGRQALPAGQLYWTEAILSGAITVNNLAATLIANASAADAAVVAAKVAAADQFDTDVSTSTSAILAYNSTSGAFATGKNWLATITSAATEAAAVAPGGSESVAIAAVVSQPVAPVVLNGNPVSLSAQIFNAINSNSGNSNDGSTLVPFDNLTGSSHTVNNVLNVISDGSSLAAGVTLTNIQTINISSSADQSVDTSGWSSVTALNVNIAETGTNWYNRDSTITAGANTAVTVTGDNLNDEQNLTVNGGTSVTITATGNTYYGNVGDITVASPGATVVVNDTQTTGWSDNSFGGIDVTGGAVTINSTRSDSANDYTRTTGSGSSDINVTATGAVIVNATDTYVNSSSYDQSNIYVTGGTDVTINSLVNASHQYEGYRATIGVMGATGVVTVNNDLNLTYSGSGSHYFATDSVFVQGGSSVVVNNVVTTSAASTAAIGAYTYVYQSPNNDVVVLDGGTATSVTVNQTYSPTAIAAAAAQAATAAVVTPGGPGYSAVTTPGTAAVAATAGVAEVNDGYVEIGGQVSGGHSWYWTTPYASTTITSVTLNNYSAGAEINSAVLSSLTLAGYGDGVDIYNEGATSISTLALNLNGLTDSSGIYEYNVGTHGVTTLNITTGGATASYLDGYYNYSNNDGSYLDILTTLTVAGTQTLTLDYLPTSLTTITISGAAGFDGDISGLTASGTTLAFTTTSSGTITTTLHSNGLDTFAGSTGQDIITITADQTKAVTGGSATDNEIILSGDAATFTPTGTVAHVTGFTTFGVTGNSSNTAEIYDMSVFKGYNAIDVISGSSGTG